MAGLGYYAPLKTDDSVPNSNEPDDATVMRKESAPSTSATVIAKRKFLLGLGLLAGTAALFAFYPTSTFNSHPSGNVLQTEENEQLAQCPSMLPLPASPPAPINVWASLTVEESVDVYNWLTSPSLNLNLSLAETAQLNDNVLYHIEAFRPRKTEALAYLADPGHVSPPERYARVTINHGAAKEPYIMDYLVGPLPQVSVKGNLREEKRKTNMTMTELKDIYHRDDIPFNARGFVNMAEISTLFMKIMLPLAPVTSDLFNATVTGQANDTLIAGMAGPFSFDGSFRRGWVSWRRNVPGPWIHPINFFQYVDVSGNDPNEYKLLKIVYNHQVFPTLESFVSAWKNKTLKRLPPRPDNADDSWSTRKRPTSSPPRDLDHLPGPRSVSFAGLRFRVDRTTQYISWLGWGLYLGFDRDMGLSLWDVRFRGERIIYELAPQEALAQYAGNDPMQSTTAWLDRYFGMGTAVRDMLPGYDCPHEAVYLPAVTFTPGGYVSRERAVCVFESDPGRPVTRHTGYMEGEFGAVRGYVLTVRSISTVGNYDYLFDYMFHIDGTIEVRVSASGYLQGGFWEGKQEGYGTRLRDTTMGSLHDHVINFKVDLDIVGTSNSLLSTTTSREEIEQPWLATNSDSTFDYEDDWGTTVIQQKIHKKYIENEDEAMLEYPHNFQGGYAIVNREESNKWGVPRGYAVHQGYNPVHNTIVGSKRLLNNANWARYNLAVSVRKENEPSSSSMFNMNLPGKPVVDFHKFFNGDNMTQTDLVAWINVGTHHLPQAEDSPNTRTNTAASSFFLTPLNYFDSDVSMDSLNAVLLSHPKLAGDAFEFTEYGVQQAHCVPRAPEPFKYEGMKAYGVDGRVKPQQATEELRKEAELFHRIKIEL